MDQTKADDTHDGGETDRIIAEELERLLESPMFIRSPVLSRLLQFLADHRLRGGRAAPKAYAIATEALGRSADFDPAIDSYPRVMVGRLRGLLDRYYADTAWMHRLRVPQGSYEIVVQHRASPPTRSAADREAIDAAAAGDASASPGGSRGGKPPRAAPAAARRGSAQWAAGLLVVVLVLLAGWAFVAGQGRLLARDPVPLPVLQVSAPVAGETGESRALARALDGKLRDGLRRFDLVNLQSAQAPGSAAAGRIDFRLDSSLVRTTEGATDVTLVLNRVADQRIIWSEQFRLGHDEVPEFRAIEPAIAQIAGDYGVVVRDQLQRQPDNFAAGFPCLAQFNRLRQMRTPPAVQRVDKCLRASLRQSPRDPVTLTALSLLRFGDWQPQRLTLAGREAFAEARVLAEQSYQNGPNTSAGLFAMARASFYGGDCSRGSAMGEAALRLNPYDPDVTGFLGLFKVACGRAKEGEALLRRSLALDDSYPGVPAVSLAFMLSQRDEQAVAMDILDRMPSPSNLEPQYMMVRAIVLARQGNVGAARQLWRQLLVQTGQRATAPPETVLRQFMITPAVIVRASAALRSSGVVPAGPAQRTP
ncbi:MAG: tetratricopeptide repeat protein [Sphingopyxis sp.]|uniref:tetratricopeptide repeat protein n=1 Tax=Sphingopyxis sp. TaxID=1908224 RepID=UPI003D80F519